ncbi:hypothetical protein [Sphingobium psychrophilum]|nr:hypothetical protein [Sphingobium psychrophilum]
MLHLNVVLVGLSGETSLDATGSDHYLIKDAIRQSIAVLTAEWID